MRKIKLPRTSERIRGVSPPVDDVIFVCDYDEVFKITLTPEPKLDYLDDDPYEFLEALPFSLGVYEHKPILESNGNKISYEFVSTRDTVTVSTNINGVSKDIEFTTFSGDWFAASFSQCGKYLVLAEPYLFEVYEV